MSDDAKADEASKITNEPEPAGEGERIAKVIARSGLCSRRDAEVLVASGRVTLDGRTVEEPGTKVKPGQAVAVDERPIPQAEPARLFRYYKPLGVVTAARDPEGRRTIYDAMQAHNLEALPRLMPVGRLDINSEGLLLLTNDGGLKRRLELPATGWLRRYRVRAFGRIEDAALGKLKDGVTVDGVKYGPVLAKIDKEQGANLWLSVGIREGKNREVRRVLEHLGLRVNRLIRVAYGPFQLGQLEERWLEEVPGKVLKEQLGSLGEGLILPESKRHNPLAELRAERLGLPPEDGAKHPQARRRAPRARSAEPTRDLPPPRRAAPARDGGDRSGGGPRRAKPGGGPSRPGGDRPGRGRRG